MPDFSYEKRLWKKGFKFVAGTDEVGRGAWVGPVVAATVIFAPNTKYEILDSFGINDSKLLKPKQREKAEVWIKENCLAWGVGEVPVTTINRLGLTKASRMAFRKSVKDCNECLNPQGVSLQAQIDFLLIDAFYIPYTKGIKRKNQLAIIKGDAKSYSIAAASIIAKVYRDKLVKQLHKKHPHYGWSKNKGYGTKQHQQAILKHGSTRLHRKMFLRKLLESI